MYDVILIGGNSDGLQVAQGCLDAGLNVLVIDSSKPKPDGWPGDWLQGRGVVNSAGLVAVLDTETADERRLVQARAIALSLGKINPIDTANRMLGISKLGATFTPDGHSISTDLNGRTRAQGIYATGEIASQQTPGIIDDIVKFCSSTLSKS